MTKFLIRRLLQTIPTMLGITILSFGIMSLSPGGPVATLTFGPNTPPAVREIMAGRLGLDKPVYIQYFRWLAGDAPYEYGGITFWGGREIPIFDRTGEVVDTRIGVRKGVIRGDFGNSLFYNRPVMDMIMERLVPTLELGGLALIMGLLIGVPVGILAAVWQGGIFDNTTRIVAVIFSAVPIFFLGLVLLLIFGKWLEILPMGNRCPIYLMNCDDATLTDKVKHLILPVFTLSTGWIAILSRFMRAATLEVLGQDYIRTAQAKGLSNTKVWFVHATRNAMIPIVTILGPAIPGLIGGALLTETIFSWPGLGRLSFEAVVQKDYPFVMAVVIISGVATVFGYLLSDIMYAVVDPRVRLS